MSIEELEGCIAQINGFHMSLVAISVSRAEYAEVVQKIICAYYLEAQECLRMRQDDKKASAILGIEL